jgi:hypothetical protein
MKEIKNSSSKCYFDPWIIWRIFKCGVFGTLDLGEHWDIDTIYIRTQ